MEAGTHIRLGGRIIYVSPVAWLMTAIGLAYMGQILVQGGFGEGRGGVMGFGGVEGPTAWATGSVAGLGIFRNGEWWRLASGIFLHGDAIHLLFNAWALYQLGWLAVRIFGPARFLVAYLASGLAGAVASTLWMLRDGGGLSLGASGAVCGILGLLYADLRKRPDPQAMMIARQLGMWAVIILLMGLFSAMGEGVKIDNAGHIGGFAAGYLLASVLSPRMEAGMRGSRGWAPVHGVLAGLVLFTVVSLGFAAAGAPSRHAWLDATVDFAERVTWARFRLTKPAATLEDIRRSLRQAELPDGLKALEEQVDDALEIASTDRRGALARLDQVLVYLTNEIEARSPDIVSRQR